MESKPQENPAEPKEEKTPEPEKDPIEVLKAEVAEKESKYMYLYADFENFKKRAFKERADIVKFGWEPVATELLSVLDNLERALQHTPEETDKNFLEGIKMVTRQFFSALEKNGVQAIETKGKTFDPSLHEAVGEEAGDAPAGQILREEQKGYTLHGRLLRPARVVVSSGSEK